MYRLIDQTFIELLVIYKKRTTITIPQYYNTNQQFEIKAIDGSNLKRVEDFKYLRAWIDSSEKDLKSRKAFAWRTCHQMRNIWKSTLSRKMKLRLMHITVESVLLYGSDTWTLTKTLLKQLDGTYIRILRWY